MDEMVYSDNPYVDILVHYTKQLTIESIVKDSTEADNNETIESRNASLMYINTIRKKIPVDDYVETNAYYRLLAGLPPIPTEDEKIYYLAENPTSDPDKMYWIPLAPFDLILKKLGVTVYLPDYLHEADSSIAAVLKVNGIMDMIMSSNQVLANPDKYKYIEFIGSKRIDPIKSRMASDFQLLYLPDIDYSEIKQKYETIYEKNRLYVLRCIYSEAYRLANDYYDKFIIMLIKVMTMMDMIAEVFDYLIHMDIFDSRTIRFLFESYGVDYYSEIPTKYQVAMLKNMNMLLKYKSTNRNIVDICSLFGCENIEVFKYYIMKERIAENLKFNEDGTEDYNSNYTLKFIKVPLEDSLDNYTQSLENRVSYDDVTEQDPFWYGVDAKDLDVISYDDTRRFIAKRKREILEKEFSYERTKYISIDSTYDIAKMSQEICYFYNMIFDTVDDDIMVKVPALSKDELALGHLFSYIIALGYIYNGVQDDIITNDLEKNMYIYGFDFGCELENLAKICTDLVNNIGLDIDKENLLRELMGGKDFKYQSDEDLQGLESYERFISVFENNIQIVDYLENILSKESDKDIYDLYELIYKSLMTREFSVEYFEINGVCPDTYSEFLRIKSPDLYQSIQECLAITNEEKRKIYISNIFDNVIYALEEYFDSEKFKYIYNIIPTRNISFITQCIIKVVNFFKSYKTQMIGFSTIYKIDDKLGNRMDFLENIILKSAFDFYSILQPNETTKFYVSTEYTDDVDIFDEMDIDASWKLELNSTDTDDIFVTIETEVLPRIEAFSELNNIDESLSLYAHKEIEDRDDIIFKELVFINIDDRLTPDDFVVAEDADGLVLLSARTLKGGDLTLFTEYPEGNVTTVGVTSMMNTNFTSITIPEGIVEIEGGE